MPQSENTWVAQFVRARGGGSLFPSISRDARVKSLRLVDGFETDEITKSDAANGKYLHDRVSAGSIMLRELPIPPDGIDVVSRGGDRYAMSSLLEPTEQVDKPSGHQGASRAAGF